MWFVRRVVWFVVKSGVVCKESGMFVRRVM